MESRTLDARSAGDFQTPKADLPSLPSRRCPSHPPVTATLNAFLVRQTVGGPPRDSGQCRKAHRWCGRREGSHTTPTHAACPGLVLNPETKADPKGLDCQAQLGGAEAVGNSHDFGPCPPGARKACPRSRVGSAFR